MRKLMVLRIAFLFAGCGGVAPAADNPFLQDMENDGKEDSAYLNPDGIEVEVDIEADVEAPSWRIADGPAALGQYALTYFRERSTMYIESLAEDSTADDRAEWLVNGTWYASSNLPVGAKLRHFRMRGLDAVLLLSAAKGVTAGKVFQATVPMKPFSTMTDAGATCATPDDHIGLDQSVYWYLWNPDRTGCKVATQQMTVTISKMFSKAQRAVYPEFDQLLADKKVTAVVLFGQIGDGAIANDDIGMESFRTMQEWLREAAFKEVSVSVGKRFTKTVHGNTVEIDLYSPHEFAGLDDSAHFKNFQKALSEHEIVAYDGHSMLGASDFWAQPTYPDFYQVFLYGGCLGYEYYVRPIVNGKNGWKKLDIVSSVVEVSATANDFAGPFLSKLIWALDHGNRASWRDMLIAIRKRVGDSTFGASGVRGNCYSPYGALCTN